MISTIQCISSEVSFEWSEFLEFVGTSSIGYDEPRCIYIDCSSLVKRVRFCSPLRIDHNVQPSVVFLVENTMRLLRDLCFYF